MAYFTLTSDEHKRFQYLISLSLFHIGDIVKVRPAGNDSSFPTYPISYDITFSNHLISQGDEIASVVGDSIKGNLFWFHHSSWDFVELIPIAPFAFTNLEDTVNYINYELWN